MSISKTLAAGVISLAAFATAAPAQATSFSFGIYGDNGGVSVHSGPSYYGRGRGWDYNQQRLSPHQVRRILRDRGFEEIRFTDTRGRVYQAVATGRRGARVALTISARNGPILEIKRLRRHYNY